MYQYVNISSWKYTLCAGQWAQLKYLKVQLRLFLRQWLGMLKQFKCHTTHVLIT